MLCRRPMILKEHPITNHCKASVGGAKGLPKRIGMDRREIVQTGESVGASEPIRHCRVQMDAVNCCAHFPQMMPERVHVCVGQLAVCLTAPSVPIVWAAEVHQS